MATNDIVFDGLLPESGILPGGKLFVGDPVNVNVPDLQIEYDRTVEALIDVALWRRIENDVDAANFETNFAADIAAASSYDSTADVLLFMGGTPLLWAVVMKTAITDNQIYYALANDPAFIHKFEVEP